MLRSAGQGKTRRQFSAGSLSRFPCPSVVVTVAEPFLQPPRPLPHQPGPDNSLEMRRPTELGSALYLILAAFGPWLWHLPTKHRSDSAGDAPGFANLLVSTGLLESRSGQLPVGRQPA